MSSSSSSSSSSSTAATKTTTRDTKVFKCPSAEEKQYYVARFVGTDAVDMQNMKEPRLYQAYDNLKRTNHQLWRQMRRRLASRRDFSNRREEQKVLRELHSERPWRLEDSAQQRYEGRLEGEMKGNVYWMMVKGPGNTLNAVELGDFYNFRMLPQLKERRTIEEAEKYMNTQTKRDFENHWSKQHSSFGRDGKKKKENKSEGFTSMSGRASRAEAREHTNEVKERLQLYPSALDQDLSEEEPEEEVEWDGGDHDIDYDQVASDDEVEVDEGEQGSSGDEKELLAGEEDEDEASLTQAGRDMKRLMDQLAGRDGEEDEDGEDGEKKQEGQEDSSVTGKRKWDADSTEASSASAAAAATAAASASASAGSALTAGKRPRIEQLDRKSYEYRLVLYLQRKGGKLSTKKLIKHFRDDVKDPHNKAVFQRAVKKVSDLNQENNKMYLVLKPEYSRRA